MNIVIELLIRVDIYFEYNKSFIIVKYKSSQYPFLQGYDLQENIHYLQNILSQPNTDSIYRKNGEKLINIIETNYRKIIIEKIIR